MHFWTPEGRQILDGIAGLWCVNAGHARPKIVKAIAEQAAELDYAPPFNMGAPKAFELAERLVQLTPAGLDKVFFTNSGSESVETALKMAIAYHRARGEGHAHPADRPRARLPRRQLRRHLGGRHRRQPQDVRPMLGGVDTSATRTTWRATLQRGVPRTAPNWPTTWSAWSRCTTPRPSPR